MEDDLLRTKVTAYLLAAPIYNQRAMYDLSPDIKPEDD